MKKLAAILILTILTACQPSRPSEVSQDAFWVKGFDEGAWVELGDMADGKFYAAIYHEDGASWADGWFAFVPLEKNPEYRPQDVTAEYIEKHMNAFNGSEVSIADFASGRTLVYKLQK